MGDFSTPRSMLTRGTHRAMRYSVYTALAAIVLFQFVYGAELPPEGTTIECTVTSSNAVLCNGITFDELETDEGWRIYFDIAMSIFLVLFAGTMSGLTMGLMSLDITNLKIIAKSGDEKQQKYAKQIMPIVQNHHLLLVTLLTANAIAMEALPLFLDRLVGPVLAIILSVTLVLLFGEIIPQAICTRFGLAIGAVTSPLVWVLIVIFIPVGYPVSKVLDCVLGHDSGTFYRRAQLKEMVGPHGVMADQDLDPEEGEERLTNDEITIIKGALDLRGKDVTCAMTPIERVSMLEFDDVLDTKTCERLVREGHSRWPVYRNNKNNIIGMILVKSLIMIDPKDSVRVKDINLRRLPVVNETMPLYKVLDMFQQGKSHMAVIIDSQDCITTRGIITLEDVVEELIGEEILDETDVFEDVAKQVRVVRAFRNEFRRASAVGIQAPGPNSTSTSNLSIQYTKGDIDSDEEPNEKQPLL